MFENVGEEIEIVTNFNLEPAGTDADGERITKIRNCDRPLLYLSEKLALIDACDYVARPEYYLACGFGKWSELLYESEFLEWMTCCKELICLDSDFLPQMNWIK